MKKLLVFLTGVLLFVQQGYSQQSRDTAWVENFDDYYISFSPTPSTAWGTNTSYSVSPPNSCWGKVPSLFGDSIVLTTPYFDLSRGGYNSFAYAYLRFSHICKISPSDTVYIQYRANYVGSVWELVPGTYYNANSYVEWQGADSMAIPNNSWWKEERIDVTNLISYVEAQFRFVIKRGHTYGSNVSYGWLLDNFELFASVHDIKPPIVEFVQPLVNDTVYNTGPWEINAKVKTSTVARILPPFLRWSVDNWTTYDSVLMTMVSGDSLWKANIPQYVEGTKVWYAVTGIDSTGNTASDASDYFIMLPPPGWTGYEIAGIGNSTSYQLPINTNYPNSWTRQLYLSSELGNAGISGGWITELAWDYAAYPAFICNNQMCYFKIVNDISITNNVYVDPVTDGATLVWQGSYVSPAGRDWVNLSLMKPFYLPAGKNLMIYWMNAHGSYGNYYYFYGTNMQTTMAVYRYCDGGGVNWTPANCSTGGNITAFRPNARFYFDGGISLDNSAAMYSIDINDTVPTSSVAKTPIVVTVKNKGFLSLDSVTVSYTLNGYHVKDTVIIFNPALLPDFDGQDTIGYYNQKMEGYDTITVWVTYPNGITDTATWDYTLTKIIYGTNDLFATFINPPADTVFYTGPFNIIANIRSLTGKSVSNVRLYVESDIGGTTYYDSLQMAWNPTVDLWDTIIVQAPFGSNVRYKLSVTDYLSNVVNIAGRFHVKLLTILSTDTSGYVIVGDSTVQSTYNPFYFFSQYSWTRQIYLASEIRESGNGGRITHIAWDYPYGLPLAKPNQKCYLKAVDDTVCVTGYVNPVADGATFVWQGTFSSSAGRTWAEIALNTPFMLPPGKNLMVYWIDEAGVALFNAPRWNTTTTADYMAIYEFGTVSLPVQSVGTLTYDRPNARFFVERVGISDSNSIALQSLDAPGSTISPGVQQPIIITVRNEGFKAITSCNVYWSKNGTLQPGSFAGGSRTYNFPTPLQSGYTQTITVANYTTSLGKDTIVVWVKLPNGQMDPMEIDDTARVITSACPLGVLTNSVIVGRSPAAAFSTIRDAVFYLSNCGFTGRLNLQLESGTYNESVDLSTIRTSPTDTLVIMPLSGTVIIETKNYAFLLNNADNIYIRNIRINLLEVGNPMLLEGGCGIRIISGNNLEISGCTITLDTTLAGRRRTESTYSAIYKDVGRSAHHVRILNNTLIGGYNGVVVDGNDQFTNDTAWTFDGNTIINHFYFGVYALYVDFESFSRNICLSMFDTTYMAQTWAGFCVQHSTTKIMEENKIYQRSQPIYVPRGILLHTVNSNATDYSNVRPMECRNNEIILKKTNNFVIVSADGVQEHSAVFRHHYSSINFDHNSIHLIEDMEAGITAYNVLYMNPYYSSATMNRGTIRNNNLIADLSSLVYLYDGYGSMYARVEMDYNNYYTAGSTFGCYNYTYPIDLAGWQAQTLQDSNSIDVFPNFVNLANNMKLTGMGKLMCPPLSNVVRDIEQTPRGTVLATMGAYESFPVVNLNATLFEITGLREGSIGGQTDSLKVVVLNTGLVPLISVNISWSYDGVHKSTQNYPLTPNLASAQSDTITIGPITYLNHDADVKVWINTVNGIVIDDYQGDDTLTKTIRICPNGYSGVYTVGPSPGNYFNSVDEAIDAIGLCGAVGDITLAFESGYYYESFNFTNNSLLFGNHHLTITSQANDANSVVFQSLSGAGITIGNTKNLTIKAITVDARASNSYGIYFNAGCTNLVIRDCKILCDTLSSSGYPIYKSNNGLVDSVFFINNLLEGGYYGWYFYGGTGTAAYGTNVVFDSNTVINQYYGGCYPYYIDFISYSHNTVLSRRAGATTTSWYGLRVYYVNGPVVGNRIIQRSTDITYPYPVYSYYHNYYNNNSKRGLFANNEVIFYTTSSYYGMYCYYGNADFINNSFYQSGTGDAYGIYLYVPPAPASANMRNNNIVMEGEYAYPIYVASGTLISDYNNLWAPNYVGYAGGARRDILAWQNYVTSDTHSVSVLPSYVDVANSLDLMPVSFANDSLHCPVSHGINTDIDDKMRASSAATMGAYERPAEGLDLMVLRIRPVVNGIIDSQLLTLTADVVNFGAVPIDSAVLRWSLNGTLNPTPIQVGFSPALQAYQQQNVFIDTFTVRQNYDVVVWVESVNAQADTVNWNDTAFASYVVVPLAEFIAPLVPDTINQLAFNVYANIYEGTGAPVAPPQIDIHTIVNGVQHLYDRVNMVKVGGNWVANIPPQYFNSKVIYSLQVSDTMGNSVLLIDSTFIKFDAGSLVYNLELSALISPVNEDVPCDLSLSPVTVLLTNVGGYDYNFARDNIILGCEIKNPDGTDTVYTKLINTGSLQVGRADTFDIVFSLQLFAGATDIKVWVSSPRDVYSNDDTVTSVYFSSKLGLPLEEDFSNPALPTDFTSIGLNTPAAWEVMQGSDGTVVPQYGTGMLRFNGGRGTVSQLYLKSLDIFWAKQPTLTFWYYHDTVPCDDYTIVKVVLDGNLDGGRILRYVAKQDLVQGWKQYDISLASYTMESCIVIVFESMNFTQSQYIDKIHLHSTQDLALDTILISPLAVCDFDNKDIYVVMSNPSGQSIVFPSTPTRINLRINSQEFIYSLDTGTMLPQMRDTIKMTTMSFTSGTTYNLTAMVMDPIDAEPLDDTTRRTLVINPDIEVKATPNTNPLSLTNCLALGLGVSQRVTVYNRGNFDVYDIPLTVEIYDNSGQPTILHDTLEGFLQTGTQRYRDFYYTAPSDRNNVTYNIVARAELNCDAKQNDNQDVIQECVDGKDISLLELLSPSGLSDPIGESIYPQVKIANLSPYDHFGEVDIHARISAAGMSDILLNGSFNIPPDDTITYTFTSSYKVPNVSKYTITVFIDRVDIYSKNDTITRERQAAPGIITIADNGFALGQNIPNPANDNTYIEYYLPEDGQLIFTVYTITGQILHTETKEATSGKSKLEFNTINLANGIYYYSMEYKGERLVKKMTIRK